jgi:hypothetical protein
MIHEKHNSRNMTHLALLALLLGLFWPDFAGATGFYSIHAGSWFAAPDTWGQSSSPGNGDDVEITTNVTFDSSTSGQSVTVSNLDIDGGILSVGGPATLGMAGTNSYWNNAALGGSLVQLGGLTLAGTSSIGNLSNQGVVHQTGTAVLQIRRSSLFANQVGGIYNFEGDGGIAFGGGAGGDYAFQNLGLVRKSNGTGTSTIGVPFNSLNGTIEVDSGTLSLAAGGSSSSGTFIVASGAVLDLTGGSNPTWAGLVSGSGAGTVSFDSGAISANPSLTLNLPAGLFQWTGGLLAGTTINNNAVTIAGSGAVYVNGVFYNYGFLRHTNTAMLGIQRSSFFDNQAGGTYDFEGDGSIGFGGGNGGDFTFQNFGLLRKSGGGGTSAITTSFDNQNGTIEVDSGTLSLYGGSNSNGTFNVASGAVLDVTGGSGPTWAGQMTGSGAGQVSLNSGGINSNPSLTLNLPDGLFQWTGGSFSGTTINTNVVTIAGSNSVIVAGVFYNSGLVRHTNAAMLGVQRSSFFDNQPGGTYDFEADGSIGFGGGNGGDYVFQNFGLLRKSGGSGISTITTLFNNQQGTIEVDSGTLSLAAGGSSSNGTFNVASGAVLDLTGGSGPTWAGQVNGSGAGQVQISSGGISSNPSLTLNLPGGLFQWTNGWFSGATINSNAVTIAGAGSVYVAGGFYNYGLVHHTNTATLRIQRSSFFNNQSGATYNFEADGGVGFGGGTGGDYFFQNFGRLRKNGGTGTSTFSIPFNNLNGTIEVDSGTLSLAGGGGSSNGMFVVASGAVLDLTGGSGSTWAGEMAGSGAGQVSLNSGGIGSSPSLTLNLPDGLFQWTGGYFSGTTVNSNVVTIAGSNSVIVTGVFYNNGLVRHTNTAMLGIQRSSLFDNQAGGTYDFEGDGGIVFGGGNGGDFTFQNFGLLRKSEGNGTSTISTSFYNQNGDIEVDCGQLFLNGQNYDQGGGNFIVTLGGTNAGQFGQLLCGSASLGGPLNVKLAGGYVPAIGSQFQILSSGGLGGAFTTLNVPGGIAVTYSNNSVFLTVTGTVTGKLVGPALSGNNFTFSVVTVSNQSYTIQRNDNLNTTNWVFYTNFAGDGSLVQLVSPVTNAPQRYFRLRQP